MTKAISKASVKKKEGRLVATVKATDFDPERDTKAGSAEDEKAEQRFLDAHHAYDDDRFGNPVMGDNALRLAFRAGMSWARNSAGL